MINVLFAIKDTHYQLLRDNFRYNADGSRVREDLTVKQARKLRTHIAGHWKSPSIAGNVYHVISWTIPEIYDGDENDNPDPSLGLKWVNFLTDKWPNVFIVLGAWNKDGSQFGTTLTPATYEQDQNGDIVEATPEVIEGTPFYPIHPRFMDVMPDDVTYEGNARNVPGTPTSTPAAAPKQCNVLLGWKPRRWA